MNTKKSTKFLAIVLVVVMLMSVLPLNSFAAILYDEDGSSDDYYKLISKRDWQIAPGVEESEVVLNTADGGRKQVIHTAKVDLNNPYAKIIPGYKGMIPTPGNLGTEATSQQALNAEKLGYGNVVVATNASLSWYNDAYYTAHPEYTGEPLGYAILDGYYYEGSRGPSGSMGGASGPQVAINYDVHPVTGEPRPADMPKVQVRTCADPLTGWEQYSFSGWQWLVKPDANGNPVNQCGKNHTDAESRTWVGITADGEIFLNVCDGGQAPYSFGLSLYEEADYMIKLGAVYAFNLDGGGSTTFCSQRPGESLKVNCSLADGGERPTTNTLLVISTAPADGVLANATITSQYDYYTPGSSVEYSALGNDASGEMVAIPSDVAWTIKEDGMGTIFDGVFTSNGTEGTVTAQMIYNGQVVGEHSITIATPDDLKFDQSVVTIPFGKTVNIPAVASIGNGLFSIGVGANDIIYEIDNPDLGVFIGSQFVAVDEANAPANLVGNVTATLNMGSRPTATVQFKLGKASEVLWDFEAGQVDVDEWYVVNNRTGANWDYDMELSLATREDGQVHDGNYSLRLVTNGLHSKDSHSEQYAYIRLGCGAPRIIENARSVGFWIYVPEDNIQCWIQGHYKFDSNDDGVLDSIATINMMDSEYMYRNIDESGWHYLEMDISKYKKVALTYGTQFNGKDFFFDIIFHKAINNPLWQTNGSINGQYTYYFDNFTVDYSEAVDDREEPVIGGSENRIYLTDSSNTTLLNRHEVAITTENVLSFSAEVADAAVKKDGDKVEHPLTNISGINVDSAKIFIDGVLVPSTLSDGILSATVKVADGYHRVKYEVCDNVGNKAVSIRVIKVESDVDASTLKLVPADATLDRIFFGSIYWMNLEANKIETIQKVETVIDLNNVNHWQLDHMKLAYGFTAEYTIDAETNTATITITRTGDNDQQGNAILAKLPVRIVDFDNDMRIPGYTAATVWTTYKFWPQDMKMDVDKGLITFVDGYTSDVLNTFSNEQFHVDTEMYTHTAGMIITDYFKNHGTTHVHTPEEIDDKAPTCTGCGYEGRTFCFVCNSVVEWGTMIPATGHTYVLTNGKFVCSVDGCGKEMVLGTGIFDLNGKKYYAISGSLVTGWQQIGDEWYYFDPTTYEGINGKHKFDGIEYNFTNGLVEGVWKYDGVGTRYYYGPGYYYNVGRSQLSNFVWETINGETYAFDRKGYRYEGYAVLTTPGGISTLYQFTDEGVLIGEADMDGYTGIFICEKTTTYLKDGVPFAAGLVKDGDDYYYIDSACKAVVGNYGVTRPNGILLPGYYQFDENGKMIDPPVYPDGPNPNGFFYRDGKKLPAFQLVEYEGNYYFINDFDKYAFNIRLYLSEKYVEGSGLSAGYYNFDSTGKMYKKDGPDADGYFYIDDVQQKAYQLIKYGNDYYFISDGNKYAVNCRVYLSQKYVEGTDFPAGYYDFDSTGKLYLKNGPDADGYFYLNGVKQKAYQLIKYEGSYYFINDANKYAVSRTLYMSAKFIEAYGLPVGYYDFDETGKMVLKNGPDADGYFYLNNVKQKAYQLVEYEGGYYFINDANKYAKNMRLYMSQKFIEGTGLAVGYYDFDETGKLVIVEIEVKNGPDADGYFYLNGVKQKAYQLVKFEGSYYFINDANKYAVSRTLYMSAKFIEAYGLPVGYYDFDETGKMVLKNGPDTDGYFYLNNVKQKAYQLVEYEGGYYFINDANKYAKNMRLYMSQKFIEGTGLAVGYYDFDETGRMVLKNGPDADGYFYLNNVKQKAYQLIEYEGDYYFINDANKYAKDKTIYLSDRFVEGFGLKAGYYEFDSTGKIMMKNGPFPDGFFYLNGLKVGRNTLIYYEGDYYYIDSAGKYVKDKWQYTGTADAAFVGFDVRNWHHSFDDQGRMIGYYKGLPNGRDIGDVYNLKTTDGKDVKSGLLIRGCELDQANYWYPQDIIDIGIDRLKNEFHVKTDMDLRRVGSTGLDVFDETVQHNIYDMVLYEAAFTDAGKAKIKAIFTDLANPDNYPVYLHCTHGIDRTGTVCFFLEAVLGVPYQMCIYEYTLSVDSYGQKIVDVYNTLNSNYSGVTLKDKAEAFLKDCGITQEQIDSIREIFLAD